MAPVSTVCIMTDGLRPAPGEPRTPGLPGSRVLLSERFTESTVPALRGVLSAAVGAAGLAGEPAEDFVLAVHELMANAIRHGGGAGLLQLRQLDDVLTCEIVDHGQGVDGLPVHLPPTDQPGGRGLWLAHQLTGSLMLTRRADGVTASVNVCLTAAPAAAPQQPAPRHAGTLDPDPPGSA